MTEIHGGYLAGAITLAAFLSLFPLMLVAVAVVGFVSAGAADLPGQIIGRLGLTGEAATAVASAIDKAEESKRAASIVGLIGLMWSGLGLVAALQYAFDNAWQVTGRGFRDKAGGLLWLGGGVVLFVASFGVTTVVNYVAFLAPLTIVIGLALNLGLWLWTFVALTNVSAGWRAHLAGAIVGAVGLEVLKFVGSVYVPRAVASSSGLYGSIGTVFAILAWLFFFGRLAVYATVLNVVRWEEEHGTVTVEIELPNHPDTVAVEATRSGEAKEAAPASS